MKNINITGLLLAAGNSSRMGEDKAFLQFDGRYAFEIIAAKMKLICSSVVVVTGKNRERVEETIRLMPEERKNGLVTVYNEDYEKGMFTSLQAGLRQCSDAGFYLYHFVDQPLIPDEFYTGFAHSLSEGDDWLQPEYSGKRGHPVLFGNRLKENIVCAPKESDLRECVRNSGIIRKFCGCGFREILIDLDTPEDLTAGKKQAEKEG